MKDKFLNKEYRKAIRRVLEKNAKVLEKPDHEITYEQAQENLKKRLKEVTEQIIKGEFDDEIERERKLIKEENIEKEGR